MDKSLIQKLAIGSVQFGLDYGISNTGSKTSVDACREIVSVCDDHGINTIDTAYAYGNSEEVLSELPISDWEIISKFPAIDSGTTITHFLDQSLQRLQKETLAGYMAHDANILLNNPKLWDEMVELKQSGRVDKIGSSLYLPSQLQEMFNRGMELDIVQLPYNVFDRRFEFMFEDLKAAGVEIHIRSAFLQGLFFMELDTIHPFFNDVMPQLKYLRETYQTNKELASGLLTFCLENEHIDKVVIGVNNAEQLKENIAGVVDYGSSPAKDLRIDNDQILLPYNWKLDN